MALYSLRDESETLCCHPVHEVAFQRLEVEPFLDFYEFDQSLLSVADCLNECFECLFEPQSSSAEACDNEEALAHPKWHTKER